LTKLKKSTIISETSDKPITKTSAHYVSNPDLYNEFVLWKAARVLAEADGLEEPAIPEKIGKGIMQIANNFIKKYNWQSNTKWKDEMVGDAILNCILYVRNFDPDKSKNPFSYFTQTCYYAFLRRIEKEKEEDYVKHKSTLNSLVFQEIQNGNIDEDELVLEDFDYNASGVEDFISGFEIKKFGKALDSNEIGGSGGKTKRLDLMDDVGFL
jgi:hypothetical protein